MVNKYAGVCNMCGGTVPANAGSCNRAGRKWVVYCADCVPGAMQPVRGARSVATTFMGANGPSTVYQNARGRCIDAPCCGCCTY